MVRSSTHDHRSLTTNRTFDWPAGFERIPQVPWAYAPIDESATNYDSAGGHSWYKNLEPIVAQALTALDGSRLLIEYSCGTGILADRILPKASTDTGILNVDASPKFLRLAVEKFRNDTRVAFRLLDWIKDDGRLQTLDEAMDRCFVQREAEVLTSANAIHLYGHLDDTLQSWHRCLAPGAFIFVSSANIRNPFARPDDLILDETVVRVNEISAEIVQCEPIFEEYRTSVDDYTKMAAYTDLRNKVFAPVRPLDLYLDGLSAAGFDVLHVFDQTIFVPVNEFYHALSSYHDSVLGWVGGSVNVDRASPTKAALKDRLFLIKYSLERLADDGYFPCSWTYITCRRR